MASTHSSSNAKINRYCAIMSHIFNKFKNGLSSFEFHRDEINDAADVLAIKRIKNPGDLLYTFRFRRKMPKDILATAPEGKEWTIRFIDESRYRVVLRNKLSTEPRMGFKKIEIPDSTPEIVRAFSLNDEQALLAIVRYNRLVDTFLCVTAYSLQNHLRTRIKGIGQIETDEIYVGVNKAGDRCVIPVQAKGGKDRIGVSQIEQDFELCKSKYQNLTCRPIAVQFATDDVGESIAMFEFDLINDEVIISDERHYKLVPLPRRLREIKKRRKKQQ